MTKIRCGPMTWKQEAPFLSDRGAGTIQSEGIRDLFHFIKFKVSFKVLFTNLFLLYSAFLLHFLFFFSLLWPIAIVVVVIVIGLLFYWPPFNFDDHTTNSCDRVAPDKSEIENFSKDPTRPNRTNNLNNWQMNQIQAKIKEKRKEKKKRGRNKVQFLSRGCRGEEVF